MKVLIFFCVVALAYATKEPTLKTCLEEPDEGMCRGYFEMYYYDYKSRSCKTFIYGGCGGNENRYASEEDCMEVCGDVIVFESESDSVCELPAETGMCRGFFPRYHFDKATGSCQEFVYGGCGGNANNFESVGECENRCGKASAATVCEQDKVVGPCKAGFRRFYFNKETGKCEEFIYGGCHGNGNNFYSQEDCEEVCAA